VSTADREGLIARIRQIRRAAPEVDERAGDLPSGAQHDQLGALHARIAHLEQLVQGLQDSVHRESSRHAKRIAALEARPQPPSAGI
jgi:hypothetical protein